ncbi:MAG: HAD family phosphatase [Candidatus Omnitrophica bacterium]|nr:HAD family phosphatase [Candidatus Omnitrophota bacterium]
MKSPKAIVFDLGKVLIDFDFGIAVRRLLSRCTIGTVELQRLIDQSPLLLNYETGALSSHEFYAQVKSASGFKGDFVEFGDLFCDIFTPIEPMLELHTQLRRRAIPVFVFSNTNELATKHIRRQFPFFSQFDGYILSYEHGIMKPDARLYDVVERSAARCGAELLYLDDRPENVAAGLARGWQAVRHESSEKTWELFRQYNLVQ